MDNTKQFTVFNIRKYLQDGDELGEDALQDILSEFTCPKNPDVERFLKKNAIEFTKKNQSVTYLVFSNDTAELIGYFTLTIKPIQVNNDSKISKGMLKKISRVSEYDEESETELQFKIGGTVVFLEAEENEMLYHFYSEENGFKTFRTRETKNKEPHRLVQMLKVI